MRKALIGGESEKERCLCVCVMTVECESENVCLWRRERQTSVQV